MLVRFLVIGSIRISPFLGTFDGHPPLAPYIQLHPHYIPPYPHKMIGLIPNVDASFQVDHPHFFWLTPEIKNPFFYGWKGLPF